MTHQRDGATHVFDCDGRGCTLSFGELDGAEADFTEVWNAARAAGWVGFRRDGEWAHLCPECKREVGD